MVRKREAVQPPYTLEVARNDGGRLVEVVIRAEDGGELDPQMLQDANRDLAELFRRDATERQSRSAGGVAEEAISRLRDEWRSANGEITPEYLAALAVAYEEVSNLPGPGILEPLARALDRSESTVKLHVRRARQEGYLNETSQGRYGGTATRLARRVYEGDDVYDLG